MALSALDRRGERSLGVRACIAEEFADASASNSDRSSFGARAALGETLSVFPRFQIELRQSRIKNCVNS